MPSAKSNSHVSSLEDEIATQSLVIQSGSVVGSASDAELIPRTWGCVHGLSIGLPSLINLDKDVTTFGRGPTSSDFVFLEKEHLMNPIIFGRISNLHFSIHKNGHSAYLLDHSRHGTYVNGAKVTKAPNGNIQVLLKTRDQISVTKSGGPRFQFVQFFGCSALSMPMPEELTAKYFVTGMQLGTGASCTVYEANNVKTLEKCAMKVMPMKERDSHIKGLNTKAYIKREIEILKELQHEMIVSVFDIFESIDQTFIAMELMSGDSLLARLCDATDHCLDEGSVRVIAYQVLLALEYLHFKSIVHRDIKPANILMCSENKHDNGVKLADFGLSKWVSNSKVAVTDCGTKSYKAPEVRQCGGKAYTLKVDIWSLGATIHSCLFGKVPAALDACSWDRFSPDAKDIVQQMLLKDPQQRPSARELLDHSWFQGENFEKIKNSLPSPVGPSLPRTPKQQLSGVGKCERRLSLGARPSKPYASTTSVDHQIVDTGNAGFVVGTPQQVLSPSTVARFLVQNSSEKCQFVQPAASPKETLAVRRSSRRLSLQSTRKTSLPG